MGRPRHTSSKHFLLQHGFHLIKSLCRLASSREGDSGSMLVEPAPRGDDRLTQSGQWSHCSSWLDLTQINYFWEILSSAGHMTQWTHIQCFPLCVGICACEPLLPLWVHLGGSSLGSCALIRSTTGQLGITPSVTTNSTWEMVRVCESQRLRAAHSPLSKHRVGSMKWDLVFNQTLISPTSFHNILWIIILILCLY